MKLKGMAVKELDSSVGRCFDLSSERLGEDSPVLMIRIECGGNSTEISLVSRYEMGYEFETDESNSHRWEGTSVKQRVEMKDYLDSLLYKAHSYLMYCEHHQTIQNEWANKLCDQVLNFGK